MALTDPPAIPLITDPSTFATRAQDWVVWQSDSLYPFLADGASTIGLSTSTTSTTSNTVGIGSKSFTVETGKGFIAGMSVSIARTSAPTNRMFALVTSYNSGTGALVVNSQAFEGSGTYTDWSIAIAVNAIVSESQLSPTFLNKLKNSQDFRLTLTMGVPVTTTDVTGATTIYCTPYTGNSIGLYDGTNWNIRTSNEFSLALGTLTSGLPYDVFCYDNATVPTLEFTAWTNTTTRATSLTYQDGVLVKTGALTRRYLGTFYTTATTTTEDSAQKRYLWNYYNRKERSLLRRESTASWTYTTATLRQANNSTANQVEMVIGVNEDAVRVNLNVLLNNTNNIVVACAMGLDGTSSIIGQGGSGNVNAAPASTVDHLYATYTGLIGVGRHFVTWCESSQASGTTTWYGNVTLVGVTNYSGLSGSVWS